MIMKLKYQYKPLPDLEVVAVHGWGSMEPGLYKSGDLSQEKIGDFLYEVQDILVYVLVWEGDSWKIEEGTINCFRRST